MSWMYEGTDFRPNDWRLVDFSPIQCEGLIVSQLPGPYYQRDHGPGIRNTVHCQQLLSDHQFEEWLEKVNLSPPTCFKRP